ncbi:methylenetetrahydrofolate--tRNA-(uracil(54)-C(5))-methyltransferase (FADH(2)-oxidizing) TrmFO [Intestinibacillus massiliensis]|nr:methylenetetrahydrofolate--tRNA-(uracil(54)-C(5))-methyltransferase (FADH(2)-oxidizing) TrmFO [Intestinibacillus massiliensis]
MQAKATVIGAGLAGCEAAWQLAERGVAVTLCEMKPEKRSPAHHSDDFAELVCSNSLRSGDLSNAAGLLKEELRRLGGLIIRCADATQTPAGGALAVDREAFSRMVTEEVRRHPNITVAHGEVTEIPAEGVVVVASGPLTSDALFAQIHKLVGGDFLHFYDAAAPIVTFESIDMENAYFAARYGKGTPDYINCPMDRAQFDAFWEALTTAEEAPVHGFEDAKVFEGCMPVEVMGRRGHDTLLFGSLKPVGLPDPRTGRDPYAVLQLRRDNAQGTLYNLVGCQTHLKFGEQKRVFSMIPALKDAEFVRYGVMHRNTFLDSPRLLGHNFELRADPRIRFAGQVTGVEGYIESDASGFLAGVAAACALAGRPAPDFPDTTAIGALGRYVSNGTVTKFQPMNINFGILAPLGYRVKGKKEKNMAIAERALAVIDSLKGEI